MKTPIGVILKGIMEEKGLKAQAVADRLGFARQTIYQSSAKLDMTESEMARWAEALEVTPEEILKRWNKTSASPDLLSQQMERIEQFLKDQVEFQRQQIESQQRQIESQQRTIELLLGKSEGVSSGPDVSRRKLLLPGSYYDTFGHTQVTA